MSRIRLCTILNLLACLLLGGVTEGSAADPVFSGPQVGEKLPPFKVQGVFGDLAAQEIDLVERADGKSIALIFVHERTRPGFALTNAVMKYAATRADKGLLSSVVYLTEDATATEKWVNLVQKNLPQGVIHAISMNGIEGPGAYGLNRNVSLTVLVGQEGKVTANFALVQPSLQADGPKILEAIVKASGGGKVPTVAEIAGPRYGGQAGKRMQRSQNDPQLTNLLRAVINKQASAEEVKEAAAAVDKYVATSENGRRELGRISNTVVKGGKLSNYGTPAAQEILKAWAKKYPAAAPNRPQRKNDRPTPKPARTKKQNDTEQNDTERDDTK